MGDERGMLPPVSAEERRRTNSNLHAGPLVLQVSVCAPASFDKKDFVGNVLLALVLLREAKGEIILYPKKSEKIFPVD